MDTSSDRIKTAYWMNSVWLRRGNSKRETESFLIAAQNNTIKRYQSKNWKKKKTHRRIASRRYVINQDKTVNHEINECTKL